MRDKNTYAVYLLCLWCVCNEACISIIHNNMLILWVFGGGNMNEWHAASLIPCISYVELVVRALDNCGNDSVWVN